jgi:hypothetical protein
MYAKWLRNIDDDDDNTSHLRMCLIERILIIQFSQLTKWQHVLLTICQIYRPDSDEAGKQADNSSFPQAIQSYYAKLGGIVQFSVATYLHFTICTETSVIASLLWVS